MGNCFTFESDLYEPDEVHHKPRGSPPNSKNNNNVKNSSANRATAPMPRDVEDLRKMSGSYDVTVFTYNEMRIATKNFRPDQILGEGGFGFVYKGTIDENVRVGFTSTPVAIKVLNPDGYQGDREWLAEVNYLGQLRHSNLVKLVGYCCEGEHRLLVYEYMASGSLEKHLFKRVSVTMSWPVRMKIALGAAKGLAYLHAAERSIIYRDFKTSNILLDKEYNAKLSDFGLAKDGPRGEQTHVSTRVVGTYGYAAPEYIMTGHLTARSDVYGFGVVLLEMLIGRKSLDKSRPSREHNLVEWARPLLKHNSKLLKIVDHRLEGQYSTSNVVKVANLAYSCLSQNPRGRPDMNQVVEILETLQEPIDPKANKFLQNGSGCVTLYEAKNISTDEKRTSHRSSSDSPRDERRTSNKNSDDKDPHEHRPAHRNSAEKDPYEHKPAQKNSAERMLDEKPAPTKNHGNKGPDEHKTENGVKSPEKPLASFSTQNSVRTFRSDAQRQQMSLKTGFEDRQASYRSESGRGSEVHRPRTTRPFNPADG